MIVRTITIRAVCEWPVSDACDRANPTLWRHGKPICAACNTHLDATATRVAARREEIRRERGEDGVS